MIAEGPDLLRLTVIPILFFAAYRDIRTRRVHSMIWWPLLIVALIALTWAGIRAYGTGGLVWEQWWLRVLLSVGFLVPLAWIFWQLGAFGLADAKALAVLALLFPTIPNITVGTITLPLFEQSLGIFSMSILTNAVLLGLVFPIYLALENLRRGAIRPAMFVGRPARWDTLERRHGRLLEGVTDSTRRGVDLDALRMYLRWRRCSLADIRAEPSTLRDPESLPSTRGQPGDGRVATDGGIGQTEDPWAARTFVESFEAPYGTRPEELRGALERIATQEHLWISPGIPFLVLIVLGLVLALTAGDLFAWALGY